MPLVMTPTSTATTAVPTASKALATRGAPVAASQSVAPANSPANSPAETERHGVEALYASIMDGDLGKMTKEQRLLYYKSFCERLGLNPISKPFGFYEFQKGKISMYALKEACNQLARRDSVSVEVLGIEFDKDANLMQVTVRARSKEWRYQSQTFEERITDEIGCIAYNSEALKGDLAANQRMKGITKAKRRAILSHCGLGVIDETEVETLKARVMSAEEFIEGAKVEEPTTPVTKAEETPAQAPEQVVAPAAIEAETVDDNDFDCTNPSHMDWLVRSIKSAFPQATRALVVPMAECLKATKSRLDIITEIGNLQQQPEAEVTGYLARKKK